MNEEEKKEIEIMASDIDDASASKYLYLGHRMEIAKALHILGYRRKDKIQSIVKTANKAVLQEFANKLKERITEPLYNNETIDDLLKEYGIGEEK